MIERWRLIPGCSWYEASDHGRIRSVRHPYRGKSECVRTHQGKLLKPFSDRNGYWHVATSIDGKVTTRMVHQLVMLAFVGPPPAGHETNHRDGVKANNCLENLEYVTDRKSVV